MVLFYFFCPEVWRPLPDASREAGSLGYYKIDLILRDCLNFESSFFRYFYLYFCQAERSRNPTTLSIFARF